MAKVKLYTVQHINVLKSLLKKGFFRCESNNYIYDESFEQAYQWLFEESKKINPKWNNPFPIWCWTKRPDLRNYRYFKDSRVKEKVQENVLITLLIDEEKVIFTDYEKWHFVLNEYYLNESIRKIDLFYKKYEKNGKLSKAGQKIMKKSWIDCFKTSKNKTIQATIEEMSHNEMISYKIFKSYNKSK